MVNYNDPSEVETKRQSDAVAKQYNNDIDAFIRAAAQSREGLRFLWWLLEIGKFGSQPFNGHALTTSFSCGELNVGLQVFSRISEVDPKIYLAMVKENENAARRKHSSRDIAGNGDAGDSDD